MEKQDYHAVIAVDGAAQDVFNSINSISKWLTNDLEGSSQKLNDEFTGHFGDMHISTQKIVAFIPGKIVVWLVTGSQLSLSMINRNGTTQPSFFKYPTTAIKLKLILRTLV